MKLKEGKDCFFVRLVDFWSSLFFSKFNKEGAICLERSKQDKIYLIIEQKFYNVKMEIITIYGFLKDTVGKLETGQAGRSRMARQALDCGQRPTLFVSATIDHFLQPVLHTLSILFRYTLVSQNVPRIFLPNSGYDFFAPFSISIYDCNNCQAQGFHYGFYTAQPSHFR